MNSVQPAGPSPRTRGIRSGIIFLVIMLVVLFGSMLLLPMAILYFIDPSIGDAFMQYSAPYIGLSVIIILAILAPLFIYQAIARKRVPSPVSLVGPAQYDTSPELVAQDPSIQNVQVREIVHEIVRIRCQYCGTLNLETATKCESCGANL